MRRARFRKDTVERARSGSRSRVEHVLRRSIRDATVDVELFYVNRVVSGDKVVGDAEWIV